MAKKAKRKVATPKKATKRKVITATAAASKKVAKKSAKSAAKRAKKPSSVRQKSLAKKVIKAKRSSIKRGAAPATRRNVVAVPKRRRKAASVPRGGAVLASKVKPVDQTTPAQQNLPATPAATEQGNVQAGSRSGVQSEREGGR